MGIIQDLLREGVVAGFWDAHSGHFVDLTGNGRDGIVQAAARWEGFGIHRNDTIEGAVSVANHVSLQLTTMTVVGTFDRLNLQSGHQYILYRQGDFYVSVHSGGAVYLSDWLAARFSAAVVTQENKCFGLSIVSGGTAIAYADGLSIGNLSGVSTLTPIVNPLLIGGASTTYGSTLRHALLINRILDAAEMAQLYDELVNLTYPTKFYSYTKRTQAIESNEPGIIAGWHMRPAGGVIPDIVGASDGAIVGAPINEQGILGDRLLFDGVDDYINAGNVGTIKSVAFWTKPTTNTEDFLDLDGGTHTVEVAAGVVTATGWAAPTIFVDGVATTALAAGLRQRIVVSTATAFAANAVTLATETIFLEGTMGDVEFFSTEKDVGWALQDYLDGAKAVQFRTDWAFQQSAANEGGITGQILGTRGSPFRAGDATVRCVFETATVNGRLNKVLRCTVAGPVYVNYEDWYDCSPTEAAFGSFSGWMYKTDGSAITWKFAGTDLNVAANGYAVVWAADETVVISELGVGNVVIGGTASHSTWHRFDTTRSNVGLLTPYIDRTGFGTPAADLTIATSIGQLWNLGVGDMLSLSNIQGDDGQVKHLGVNPP